MRRVKVETGIYRSVSGKLEVCYTDSDGRVRFEPQASPNISAARARRREVLREKDKGATVRPTPKLTFGEVRARWLAEEVAAKSAENTRTSLRYHAGKLPWEETRMDRIGTAEVMKVIRALRAAGHAESTIGKVRRAADAIFKFARREMRWAGANPIADLDLPPVERRAIAHTLHETERLESPEVIAATIRAAGEAWRAPLTFVAETGVRESEALAVLWRELHLDDDHPYVEINAQLSRGGERVELKTEHSRSVVPLTRAAVLALKAQRLRSRHTGPEDYVFATSRGTPLGQRNLLRELDRAQRHAVDGRGQPIYAKAAYLDEDGKLRLRRREDGQLVRRKDAGLPSVHALRHTLASRLISDGVSVEKVSRILRHKNSGITSAVYEHEIRSARALRERAELLEAMSSGMASSDRDTPASSTATDPANLAYLREVREAR